MATILGALALLAGPARADSRSRTFGVMADIGVPDGMIGALAVQPHRRVAMHAGGGHNSFSPGLRAGVQVYPLLGPVAPYLAVEGGHYFAGGPNAMAKSLIAGAGMNSDAELEQLGYSFANGHLGLTFGNHKAAFYLQAGVSWVRTSATMRESRPVDMSTTTTVDIATQSVFRIWTPSGRIGIIAYF